MTMDDAYATCVIGYHLARLVGEDKVKEIVTEGEWDDPAVLQMAQDIEELASNGYYSEMVGSNVWPAGQNTELALGTAAMYLNGSWLPNEVKEMAGPDFHWGCFAYPALTDGANGIETNNFGAQVFGINKDTKLAKEAFDLITFLTKGEYDQKLADETVGIPADITNTEWPAKNVERPLPPRSAWPADRPTSGLCYSPRHVHVCPYVHDCLHRQAIWTVSRPASRPCPLRNARILNVPPHSHCALSRQAVSLHELSLQPAFINIIVVGTNMVSSPSFASRGHSPRWAKPHLPRMRLRGVACGRDGGWRLVETQ